MDPKRYMRVVVTVGGALGTALALFLVLTLVNADRGFAGTTGTSALGWTLPLLSGGLIGGVAWVLLLRGPNHSDDDPSLDTVPCSACGRSVMPEWRLCPYCGSAMNPGAPRSPSSLAEPH
jgi:hypothetical protein